MLESYFFLRIRLDRTWARDSRHTSIDPEYHRCLQSYPALIKRKGRKKISKKLQRWPERKVLTHRIGVPFLPVFGIHVNLRADLRVQILHYAVNLILVQASLLMFGTEQGSISKIDAEIWIQIFPPRSQLGLLSYLPVMAVDLGAMALHEEFIAGEVRGHHLPGHLRELLLREGARAVGDAYMGVFLAGHGLARRLHK